MKKILIIVASIILTVAILAPAIAYFSGVRIINYSDKKA